MKYICVKCGIDWNDGDEIDGPSHGLCKDCIIDTLTPKYRQKQLKEGYFDCFGKSCGYCQNIDCLYYSLCVEHSLPSNWEIQKHNSL